MKVIKRILLTSMIAMASTLAYAQDVTREDAINAYNEADDLARVQRQYSTAISKFEEAISISEQVGTEADDIKNKSQTYLGKMYYAVAATLYARWKQNPSIAGAEAAIPEIELAIQKTQELGNTAENAKLVQALPDVYYKTSLILFDSDDFENSDLYIDKAIEINPSSSKNYYQKGLIHSKLNEGDVEGVINFYDQAIAFATQSGDNGTLRTVNNAASSMLLFFGSKATTELNDFQNGIAMLERALSYNDEVAETYFRLSEAYNKTRNYDKAIDNANKSLNFEQGGSSDKAKIYFEIGFAHQLLGNKAEACAAFNNASFGSFKAPSEHKMKFELKCESTK